MSVSNGFNLATIVAAQGSFFSSERLKTLVRSFGTGARIEPKSDRAVDIFSSKSADEIHGILAKFCNDKPVDFLIQKAFSRQKKLLLADMESTIIEQEMLDELADVIGVGPHVADITRRAMNGELDFATALQERVLLLKGQPESLLRDVASRISLMPGAVSLLGTMRQRNAPCWLVSGGFTYFAEPVAQKLGFTRCMANELLIKDGRITGEIKKPILDKQRKRELLEEACSEFGLALSDSMVVGDGANDIPMLATCNYGGGLGVAFHAKRKVRDVIENQINYGGLDVLVYAQGERP